MRLILMIAVVALAAPASGETVTDACKKAAQFYYSADEIYADDIQAFPELDPPRVRMTVSTRPFDGSLISTLATEGSVTCKFTKPNKPFGLIEFCPPGGCPLISEERLEELQVLMKREGY